MNSSRVTLLIVFLVAIAGVCQALILDPDAVFRDVGINGQIFVRVAEDRFEFLAGTTAIQHSNGNKWHTEETGLSGCGYVTISSDVSGGIVLPSGDLYPPMGIYPGGLDVSPCTSFSRTLVFESIFTESVWIQDQDGVFTEYTPEEAQELPGTSLDYVEMNDGFDQGLDQARYFVYDPGSDALEILDPDPPIILEISPENETEDAPDDVDIITPVDPIDPVDPTDLSAVEEYLRQIRDEQVRGGNARADHDSLLAEYGADRSREDTGWLIESLTRNHREAQASLDRIEGRANPVVEFDNSIVEDHLDAQADGLTRALQTANAVEEQELEELSNAEVDAGNEFDNNSQNAIQELTDGIEEAETLRQNFIDSINSGIVPEGPSGLGIQSSISVELPILGEMNFDMDELGIWPGILRNASLIGLVFGFAFAILRAMRQVL